MAQFLGVGFFVVMNNPLVGILPEEMFFGIEEEQGGDAYNDSAIERSIFNDIFQEWAGRFAVSRKVDRAAALYFRPGIGIEIEASTGRTNDNNIFSGSGFYQGTFFCPELAVIIETSVVIVRLGTPMQLPEK